MDKLEDLSPKEIVARLDEFIVGQAKAKRAVALALRNRVRRLKLPPEIRDEVAPKNILMIGPTGVGKTEIARRVSKLYGAPFIKVEATKYTEVGYVGRDVESMIRDLMAAGFQSVKAQMQEEVREEAERRAEEALLDLLLPGSRKEAEKPGFSLGSIFGAAGLSIPGQGAAGADAPAKAEEPAPQAPQAASPETRERFREMLRAGKLEQREVEVNVQAGRSPSVEVFSGANFEELELNFSNLSSLLGGKRKKRRVSVQEARILLTQDEAERLVDQDKVAAEAKRRVEEMGIVFIDEIDKIANSGGKGAGVDVSREGVQRDLLPIVEGSKVNTKYGVVDTTHILFIAAGAFNVSKPSDLVPELQGRFPIRVELESLGSDDFERILTEPKNALTRQYAALLETEGLKVSFTPGAVKRLAAIASEVNAKTENIGARRLHTVLERLFEELSFEAPELAGQERLIDEAYVESRFDGVVGNQDLARYIL
jgi:ATP-dependent HslUV protease ATP-binding subunit HslU